MKRLLSAVLSLLILLSSFGCPAESVPLPEVESELAALSPRDNGNILVSEDAAYEKMVKWLLYAVEKTDFRGSLIVATDDSILFASGSRLPDTDGSEVTPFTTYEIGSLTKSFTAVCIMKLVQEGHLSPKDPLSKFFPEYSSFPAFENVGSIRVEDLLHMRSGLPDYMNAPDQFFGMDLVTEILDGRSPYGALNDETFVNQLLALVEEDEPFLKYLFSCGSVREPDTEYAYSNTNYRLLAIILEKVTGKPYEEYVRETVFTPCGMTGTSAMSSETVSASLNAKGWHFLNAAVKGAGDIFSSAVDLLKYDRALFGGFLLEEKTMQDLLTPLDGYACGWFVQGDTVSHTGGTPGFSTYDLVIERNGKRLYIIMLSNLNENRGDTVYRQLDKWFEKNND